MSNLSFLKTAKKALEGNDNSQFILGCHYLMGEYVHKDILEAIHWWVGAANLGHQEAQFSLGRLYLDLTSYKGHLEMSHLWLTKASKNGCYKAKDLLKFVESQMIADKNNIN